jgi:hypothetical protein
MKQIELSKGMFALVDDSDFDSASKYKWGASKGRHTWYAIGRVNGVPIRLHTFLMGESGLWVDHRDGNGLNNQRSNLRHCTPVQNEGNSRMKRTNKSGVKGVSWCKRSNKWEACICINYKTVHLGKFKDIQDASDAYDSAAIKRFGEFAMTNQRIRDEQKQL